MGKVSFITCSIEAKKNETPRFIVTIEYIDSNKVSRKVFKNKKEQDFEYEKLIKQI